MSAYDENALLERLAILDKVGKTAFAATCGERLLVLVQHFSGPEHGGVNAELTRLLTLVWEAVSGAAIDIAECQAAAEELVPDEDEEEWSPRVAYLQNAAACVAFAAQVWLTDDPQSAVWAARQVFEAADFALQEDESVGNTLTRTRPPELTSFFEQALVYVDFDLGRIEHGMDQTEVRDMARAEAQSWLDLLP